MPQPVRSGNATYILLIHPKFINETKDTAKLQGMQKKRLNDPSDGFRSEVPRPQGRGIKTQILKTKNRDPETSSG